MNIKTFFIFFLGIFIYSSSLQAAALVEDAGKATAKSFEKTLAKAGAWGDKINMAFDLAMPMGAGMAASDLNQFISEQQAAVFSDFRAQTSAITNALRSWSSQTNALMGKQMNLIYSYFSTQSNAINQSQTQAQQNAQAEANYLFQNLSLQQPASSLVSLSAASSFDQFFSQGIMATPASNFTWYNIMGAAAGDWLFDPVSNSFWQNQAVTFSATDAISVISLNSIFVEYYPSQKPYTIAGSFTLYKATFPFFAGIMFNKNRWISGDQEGQNKCRLVGIYASSATTAGIYFAEQYELSNADALAEDPKNPTPIKMPLMQIMNGHVSPLVNISDTTLAKISSEPIAFNFKITTNPTSASIKIWEATDKEPAQGFLIQNLNSSFYLYHTLGFMSPGVATEWKITAPQELTFSSQALLNLKNKVFPSNTLG